MTERPRLARPWLARLCAVAMRLPRGLRLLAPAAVMATLWWSSSRPPSMAAGGPLYDFLFNGAHIVAYGGLATAWWYALGDADRLARTDAMRPVGTLAVALALAYGLVDELHQSFTAGRVASVGDLLSDLSGAALAVAVSGALVCGDRRALRRVPWLILASLASVAAATWWL